MKTLVAAFNQEKALVGGFSVIVKTDCETDGSFIALIATITLIIHHGTRVQPGLVLLYVPCNTVLIISLYTLSLDWSVV